MLKTTTITCEHKMYNGQPVYTGNVMNALQFSSYIREHTARPDCSSKFWPASMEDEYLTIWDIQRLSSYVPNTIKIKLRELAKDKPLIYYCIRYHRNRVDTVILGHVITDTKHNLLYSKPTRDNPKTREVLEQFIERVSHGRAN